MVVSEVDPEGRRSVLARRGIKLRHPRCCLAGASRVLPGKTSIVDEIGEEVFIFPLSAHAMAQACAQFKGIAISEVRLGIRFRGEVVFKRRSSFVLA